MGLVPSLLGIHFVLKEVLTKQGVCLLAIIFVLGIFFLRMWHVIDLQLALGAAALPAQHSTPQGWPCCAGLRVADEAVVLGLD